MIMLGGYNGFSYAELAQRYGIRQPSIDHHFPSKVDLVVGAVEQGRARIREQIAVAVRRHVADLAEWLQNVFAVRVRQGLMRLDASPTMETENFMAAAYSAMLVARIRV